MRLIIFDPPPVKRANFHPLSWSRPVWELVLANAEQITTDFDGTARRRGPGAGRAK